jgi:hypothetical protein
LCFGSKSLVLRHIARSFANGTDNVEPCPWGKSAVDYDTSQSDLTAILEEIPPREASQNKSANWRAQSRSLQNKSFAMNQMPVDAAPRGQINQ